MARDAEAQAGGHQSDGGFKQAGWNIIFAAVNGVAGNFPLELKHVKSKYSNASRIWKLWESHEKSCVSGWARQEDGALINDTEVENEYYAKYKDRRRFRRKAPQYLHEMILVFADRVATGNNAISLEDALGQGPETAEDDEEADSEAGEGGQGPVQLQKSKSKKGAKSSKLRDLRKRAASQSRNPRPNKKTAMSSTRELAVGIHEANQTLRKLGNRVGQIIEGIPLLRGR